MSDTPCAMTAADTELEFAALVAFDWADAQHTGCLQAAGGPVEPFLLDQTPEAIHDWAARLRQRFGGRPVAVILEQSKGPLIYALLKHEFLVPYPINPRQLQRYREALTPSGAKDDPSDAALLLEFLRQHRGRLRAWRPDNPDTRLLAQLTEDRRTLVEQRTALVQQLQDRLKTYFPQALTLLADDLTTALAGAFLIQWPSLQDLQRARPHTVRRFFYAQHVRNEARLQDRLQLIRTARPLVEDPALLESGARFVHALAAQLKALAAQIRDYERRISELFARHADAPLFEQLPGAGRALAPRLLAAFGSDRSRFASAAELQSYSGVAPVTLQSGRTRVVRWRWACPTFLRQTFHEFAQHSLAKCDWARAFYQQQRERGHDHHAAVRSLAYKWLRILFRCWQTRTPYDESRYLAALSTRASPLLARLSPAASA